VPLASHGVSVPGGLAVPLRAGAAVRSGEFPAVAGRADGRRLLLDLRSVAPADDDTLAGAVQAAARQPEVTGLAPSEVG
jgi:L-seryl-tRNA(Ser) seleniumtransferase